MKTINSIQKYFFLVLLSVVFFACQDQVSNELPNDQTEDIANYKFDNGESTARRRSNIYVLVHGAWHPESSWKDIKWALEGCGNTVVTVQLPGLGDDTTPVETVTFQDHVDAVKNVVLQQSGPVILVGHSYGGAVISQVGEEISGKIKKLVYVNGFMPIDGENVVQLALANTESLVTQNLIVDGIVAYLTPENYGKALYNEALASRNPFIVYKAKQMIAKLRPHPFATLLAPLHLTAAYDNLDKVYISCLKDKAVTPGAQYAMYSRFPGIKVYKIPGSDHVPLITTPISLVEILRKQ